MLAELLPFEGKLRVKMSDAGDVEIVLHLE